MKKMSNKNKMARIIAIIMTVLVLGTVARCSNINGDDDNVTNAKSKITVEEAKEEALKEAGSGIVIGYQLDADNGKLNYEITITDGKAIKEYKIDGDSGKVLKVEAEDSDSDDMDRMLVRATPAIDLAKAESLVKEKYPKATIATLKLDVENGKLVYDVKVVEGNTETESKLDASTGSFSIEEVETDNDND